MDDHLRDFLQETGEHVDAVALQLLQLARDPTDTAMVAAVFRLLHTIKGTCGFLGLGRLGRLAHAAEALLGRLRDGKATTVETVDLILAAVDRIRFLLIEIERQRGEPAGDDNDLVLALGRETAKSNESQTFAATEAPPSDQQDGARTRTQPLDRLFATLPRLVGELGREFGKDIGLLLQGGDTEIDSQALDALYHPLTLLVRTCADHGLEAPAVRRAKGKPVTGTIRVRASRVAGQAIIEVGDDGRGLDLPRIGATALRRGLVDQSTLETMTPDGLAQLVFAPGFSTHEGSLDVVRTNIEAVGGDVTVGMSGDAGTCFTLRFPLTMAPIVVPAPAESAPGPTEQPRPRILTFRAGSPGTKALPLSMITRIETVRPADIERSAGRLVVRRDDGILALLPLVEGGPMGDGERPVLIIESDGHTFGLLIDEIVDIADATLDIAVPAEPGAPGVAAVDGTVTEFLDGALLVRRSDTGPAHPPSPHIGGSS